jgi:hypothetical protein
MSERTPDILSVVSPKGIALYVYLAYDISS